MRKFEKEILTPELERGKPKLDKGGRAILRKVGTRIISKRVKKERKKDENKNDLPIIDLPKSKKYRQGKRQTKKIRTAERNVIKTASGS